jgi:exonuclease VII small subunit
MSSQIEVRIKTIDEASKTVAQASSKIKKEMTEVEATNKRVVAAQKETTKSSRDLITGFSGVVTSAFSLYNAYSSIGDVQLKVDRANLQVKSSHQSVENAQNSLNSAIEKYGYGSAEAERATANLEIAQDRYALAVQTAEDSQDSMNEKIIGAALQVIPTSITMVDSLSKAWKNIPDVSGLLSKITDGIGIIGISAKTAAVGVAAFMGGFLVADTILGSIPDDMHQIAGALTATIAAIVAATVAWMAFHGTMTVGVAVPIILAAVGVGIAGVKAAVAMAEGGIVTKPTLALIGEAGPEAVIPLNQRTSETVQYITVNPVINIENISSEFDLAQVSEAVSEGIAEGFRRRLL